MKKKISSSLFVLFCSLTLVGCSSSRTASLKVQAAPSKSAQVNQHVISHRGAAGEEVEHTYRSYNLALDYGTKYIEQDLVTSKDGTLFISHDTNAQRVTGVNREYSDMTDHEIEQLRTSDQQHILKLADVFKKYQKKTTYVIELKQNAEQVQKFEKIIQRYHMQKNVIVQAGDLNALKELDEVFPKMPKLALVGTQDKFEQALKSSAVDIVGANVNLMNPQNVKRAHQDHKQFNAWTLDSDSEIKKAIDLGVDSYFTNYTAKALTLEKKYR